MSPGTGPLLLLLFCVGSAIISLASAQDPTVEKVSVGICPEDVEISKCDDPSVVSIGDCTVDQDCDGNMKCCFYRCKRRCLLPLGVKDKACPYSDNSECALIRLFSSECHSDDQCQGTERCCLDSCKFKCMPTVEVKPGLCPVPLALCAGSPQPPQCLSDSGCTGNKKCCIMYCGLGCVDPKIGNT